MHSKEKLAEAHYFLDAALRTKARDDEFSHNVSAFLGACYSTMEVMVYDFAEKYGLGFTREDYLTERDFFVASKALKLEKAMEFHDWWDRTRGSLGQNPLWGKRPS